MAFFDLQKRLASSLANPALSPLFRRCMLIALRSGIRTPGLRSVLRTLSLR